MTLSICRVCAAALVAPCYAASAPSLTSMMQLLDAPTEVLVCDACGHAQSPDLPNVKDFYASQYKISLASEDHDQLVTVRGGQTVFRTDFQTEALLEMAAPPQGARVLDYGCGKAATLRKLCAARPDVVPHVFDVSDDYRPHWSQWIASEAMATHELPAPWRGRFDLITAHFVIEHTVDPCSMLSDIASLLALGGRLFLSAPDAIANPGDLVVVDHLNHFSGASLMRALQRTGFSAALIDRDRFPGALIAVCSHDGQKATAVAPAEDAAALRRAAREWLRAADHVRSIAREHAGKRSAIYGAGFYGGFIRTLLSDNVDLACFLDRNPHAQGTMLMGLPVVSPDDVPADVSVIYAGLNPLKARAIIAQASALIGRQIVWLD